MTERIATENTEKIQKKEPLPGTLCPLRLQEIVLSNAHFR